MGCLNGTLTLLLAEGVTLQVWSGGCLVDVWRVSQGCLEGARMVSGGHLWDV